MTKQGEPYAPVMDEREALMFACNILRTLSTHPLDQGAPEVHALRYAARRLEWYQGGEVGPEPKLLGLHAPPF